MRQSPMFKHAVESFEHGLRHYLDGSETSRKFALLHVDQAVELLLKEKIVQTGKTIYKSNGTTLNFHEACKSLKDDTVPEQPRLEELHDLRNAVQHKGLIPDAESTHFYVKIAYDFFKRFMKEEYSTTIDKFVPRQYRALIEGQSLPTSIERVVTGYALLSHAADFLAGSTLAKVSVRSTFRGAAESRGARAEETEQHLETVLDMWDRISYSDYIPTDPLC